MFDNDLVIRKVFIGLPCVITGLSFHGLFAKQSEMPFSKVQNMLQLAWFLVLLAYDTVWISCNNNNLFLIVPTLAELTSFLL